MVITLSTTDLAVQVWPRYSTYSEVPACNISVIASLQPTLRSQTGQVLSTGGAWTSNGPALGLIAYAILPFALRDSLTYSPHLDTSRLVYFEHLPLGIPADELYT